MNDSPIPYPTWAIRNTQAQYGDEYWSNMFGWASRKSATVFSYSESCTLDLPIGGEWIPV